MLDQKFSKARQACTEFDSCAHERISMAEATAEDMGQNVILLPSSQSRIFLIGVVPHTRYS